DLINEEIGTQQSPIYVRILEPKKRPAAPAPVAAPRPVPVSSLVAQQSRTAVATPRPASSISEELPPWPAVSLVSGGSTYNFEYNEETFQLHLPDNETVFGTKQRIAEHYRVKPEHVKLSFAGRDLPNDSLLYRLRIGDRKIIVYIRSQKPILLKSVRLNAKRPEGFKAMLDKLILVSKRDKRDCERCLDYCDYDYDKALQMLMESLDE
ncbi:MAG: hypothetical protein LBF33_02700, partial [Oscillospiraceae bacterium]|nr:hypothetical protein [Oscillospiraceae bacterium]